MKGNFTKKMAVLLAATMLVSIIGGCAKVKEETKNNTDNKVVEQESEQTNEPKTEEAVQETEESVQKAEDSKDTELSAEELALQAQYEEALRLNGNSKMYSFNDIEKLEGNPLEGKTICVLGSSVVDGFSSDQYAVGEYFEARFGCNLIKEAVSGTTITNIDNSSYVARMMNNIDATEIDLFICQLSTNDATRNLELGEVSESKNSINFDQNTIIGSMEFIIRYAQTTWNCPVVFFTGSYYNSEAYAKMVNALSELQEKWGIGILNLYYNDEFNNISDEMRSIYMADNIHPRKAGYRDWWGPEMEKQLLAYLDEQQ